MGGANAHRGGELTIFLGPRGVYFDNEMQWAINFAGTRVFGELEFWFASIKVITILGLIIAGIVITSGGGPDHESIGFRYWHETGGFVQYAGIGEFDTAQELLSAPSRS